MNPGLLLLFIVPLAEAWLLIKVGYAIGAVPTIALVVLTAVIGSYLLKRQGISTIQRIQQAQARGQMPAQEMMEGVVLLIAGVLLLTPGFFTDVLGFSVLVPTLRARLVQKVAQGVMESRPDLRGHAHPNAQRERPGEPAGDTSQGATQKPPRAPTVLEGEFERKSD